MKLIAYSSFALILSASAACTKKVPSVDLKQFEKTPETIEETPTAELRAPEAKKAVPPPEFVRVDEDTLLVKGEEIDLVTGTNVSSTSIINTDAPALVSKDDSLFLIKTPPVLETPVLEIHPVSEGLVLDVEAGDQSEVMIVASTSVEGSDSLCLALTGRDAGRFIAIDSPECWSNRENLSELINAKNKSEGFQLSLKDQSLKQTLKDYPFIKVQVKAEPLVEEAPEDSIEIPQMEESAPVLEEEKAREPPVPTIPTVIADVAEETSEVVESLPIVVVETLEAEADEVLASPALPVEEKDRIAQMKDRIKKAHARYKEKKQKIKELRKERNQARAERKADRAKLAKDKGEERKQCRKEKKKEKTKKCDEFVASNREKDEKDSKKTKEIAELKDQIELLRAEALEDMKELKSHQNEIKSVLRQI